MIHSGDRAGIATRESQRSIAEDALGVSEVADDLPETPFSRLVAEARLLIVYRTENRLGFADLTLETGDDEEELVLIRKLTEPYLNDCEGDCPGDTNNSGEVDFDDLLAVLGAWGPVKDCPPFIPPDLNEDCDVGFDDLLLVLGGWGPCP